MVRLVLILFSALSGVLAISENSLLEKNYYDINNAHIIFEKYIKEYEKSYPDKSEYDYRFELFKENLRNINKWNEMYPLTAFNINQFSDHTKKEFRQKYTGFLTNTRRSGEDLVDYIPTGDAPEELDYRTQGLVTRVKDQLECGSCYVFSAIGNIEGQYAKKYGKLVSMSEQQCLDCDRKSGGCNGGWMHETMKGLARVGGSMADEDYPYDGNDFNNNDCKLDKGKIVAKVTDGVIYNVTGEEELKDALASIGPLSIAICVSEKFIYYSGGIYITECGPYQRVDHGVLLVGYGSEGGVDYWIIKNSWATKWGEKGYIRFARGKNLCLIGSYVATSIVN